MIHTDRDALMCDMAETYGVFDLGSLPVATVATLAAGLREDSRIKMKIANVRVSEETILLAMMVDRLSLLWWAQTKDGQKGRNKPNSIVAELLGINTNNSNKKDAEVFDSPADFEAARAALIAKIEKGGGNNGG